MRSIAAAIVPALAATLAMGQAQAEERFSGDEAAYIDWSVRNCGVASTDREHRLVDEANAKDAAGFLRKYEAKFKAKDFSAANETPTKQAHLCADIKDWYGPLGNRIPDLIKWRGPDTTPISDTPAAAAATKGHRGHRRFGQ